MLSDSKKKNEIMGPILFPVNNWSHITLIFLLKIPHTTSHTCVSPIIKFLQQEFPYVHQQFILFITVLSIQQITLNFVCLSLMKSVQTEADLGTIDFDLNCLSVLLLLLFGQLNYFNIFVIVSL